MRGVTHTLIGANGAKTNPDEVFHSTPDIRGGIACFTGTRVGVSQLLDYLRDGHTIWRDQISFAILLSVPVHRSYIALPSIVSDAVEGVCLLISSNFDVYHENGRLSYVRRDCEQHDISPTIFLHIDPVDKADLPANRQQYGFDNLDFSFSHNRVDYG